MPTIQSRKYEDNVQFVTSEAWKQMQDKGIARRFKVIDDGDIQETVIGTPEQIVDFADNKEIDFVDKTVEKVMSRDEIKTELDKLDVEYNTRASTDKLLEILNNK